METHIQSKPYKPLSEPQVHENAPELGEKQRNRGEKREVKMQHERSESPSLTLYSSRKNEDLVKNIFIGKDLSYGELAIKCTQRLLEVFDEKHGHKPSSERMGFLKAQAENTADYLFHAFTLKGQAPTLDQVANYSRVSRYVLERIPSLQKELIEKMKASKEYEAADWLKAHIVAERVAIIEGRLLLEAHINETKAPKNYRELAYQEFTQNQMDKKDLAANLVKQQNLSEASAFRFANEVIRYREKYGFAPSNKQKSYILEIAKYIEQREKELINSPQKYDLSQRELIRRKETDQLMTYAASHHSLPDAKSLKDIQRDARSFCEKQLELAQAHSRLQDRGIER